MRAVKGITPQAFERSRGGQSIKIHAPVDALGNPMGFHLTSGQASDLARADALREDIGAQTVVADKGYDTQQRVV